LHRIRKYDTIANISAAIQYGRDLSRPTQVEQPAIDLSDELEWEAIIACEEGLALGNKPGTMYGEMAGVWVQYNSIRIIIFVILLFLG